MPINQTKSVLRKAAFEIRRSLSPAHREAASAEMTQRFLGSVPLPPPGAVIGGFLPINTEISPRALMEALLAKGYRLAVPTVPSGHTEFLDYRSWTPETPVHKNVHGIDEPDTRRSEILLPDLIIVPLLAFDRLGHRIGYGSGHFDRTFEHLVTIRHKFLAYGVAFEDQRVESIPIEEHDFPLHGVVTDKTFYACVEPLS